MRGNNPWHYLEMDAGDPAFNMAFDEALLRRVALLGRPVIRFYGWTVPAASFGYFQRQADVAAATALRPLVRRPTGGGLVPHADDWTYSVAVPPGHEWHALAATESYRRIHWWLQAAFADLGWATELAPCCLREQPGQCFAGYEQHDLLHLGRKLAGAAQRRNRLGLLIQGSVQPPPRSLTRAAWMAAMRSVGGSVAGVTGWATWAPDALFAAQVRELVAARYGREEYHRRR